jgi:hypothetical protein
MKYRAIRRKTPEILILSTQVSDEGGIWQFVSRNKIMRWGDYTYEELIRE